MRGITAPTATYCVPHTMSSDDCAEFRRTTAALLMWGERTKHDDRSTRRMYDKPPCTSLRSELPIEIATGSSQKVRRGQPVQRAQVAARHVPHRSRRRAGWSLGHRLRNARRAVAARAPCRPHHRASARRRRRRAVRGGEDNTMQAGRSLAATAVARHVLLRLVDDGADGVRARRRAARPRRH